MCYVTQIKFSTLFKDISLKIPNFNAFQSTTLYTLIYYSRCIKSEITTKQVCTRTIRRTYSLESKSSISSNCLITRSFFIPRVPCRGSNLCADNCFGNRFINFQFKERRWSKYCFVNFLNRLITLYIYYDQCEKLWWKTQNIFPGVSFPWKWWPYWILWHLPRYI